MGTKYNQQNSGNILKKHPEIRNKPHKCDKSIMGAYRLEAMKKICQIIFIDLLSERNSKRRVGILSSWATNCRGNLTLYKSVKQEISLGISFMKKLCGS